NPAASAKRDKNVVDDRAQDGWVRDDGKKALTARIGAQNEIWFQYDALLGLYQTAEWIPVGRTELFGVISELAKEVAQQCIWLVLFARSRRESHLRKS